VDQVQNPWLHLPNEAPFIAPGDVEAVAALNVRASRTADHRHRFRLQTQLLPDPFTGRVDAPVVLWTANPGYTDNERARRWGPDIQSDDFWHSRSEDLWECYRRNLRHEAQAYPLFFLNPRLRGSPGHRCYTRQFRNLIDDCGDKQVARHVLVVEEFPYHSREYPSGWRMPSQAYSHFLMRKAVERGALIIALRARRALLEMVPEVRGARVLGRRSRNPALSPGNLDGYGEIVERIRSESQPGEPSACKATAGNR